MKPRRQFIPCDLQSLRLNARYALLREQAEARP